MKDIYLTTARLALRPRTTAEMRALMETERDADMKKAYAEMLDIMRGLPGREEWGSDWLIALRGGTGIGGVGFKGVPDDSGAVEIGYGVDAEYRGHGYATEAVRALLEWCAGQPEINAVYAQTEPDNAISQRVLQKCGFLPCGQGEEGPMFVVRLKGE